MQHEIAGAGEGLEKVAVGLGAREDRRMMHCKDFSTKSDEGLEPVHTKCHNQLTFDLPGILKFHSLLNPCYC